jgi:hypothetical protein
MIQRIFIICFFYSGYFCNDPNGATGYNEEIQVQSDLQTVNPKNLNTTSATEYQRFTKAKTSEDDELTFDQKANERRTRVKFVEQPSLKNNIWIPLILFVIVLLVILIPIFVDYFINKSYEKTHKEILETEMNTIYNPKKTPIFSDSDPDQIKLKKAYQHARNILD